jgi:phage/plasmid primase-like uncharacterized protein
MTAPSELATIGLDTARFKRATPTEYHGPCPFCGGNDRFRVHTDKPFPHWYCVCREGSGCNWKGWADEINPRLREPLTAQQVAEYHERAQREAEAEAQALALRLKEFSNSELWAELNRRMTQDNRQWWSEQGLPEDAQNLWQLGYTSNTSWGPAYTIPYFDDQFNAVNMQYRLTRTDSADKYRWAGLGYSSHYIAFPTMGETDQVVICEGAKKAMVFAYHIQPKDVQVLAAPSKSDWAGLEETKAGRVWIMLDPDADERAQKLAEQLGDSARIISLPLKVDDMIVKHGVGKREMRGYFRQAAKAKTRY